MKHKYTHGKIEAAATKTTALLDKAEVKSDEIAAKVVDGARTLGKRAVAAEHRLEEGAEKLSDTAKEKATEAAHAASEAAQKLAHGAKQLANKAAHKIAEAVAKPDAKTP